MKLIRKWDVVLIAVLLLIGGAWTAWRLLPPDSQTVTIYVNGQVWEQRIVDVNTLPYTITLPVKPAVMLEGEGMKIWFAHADCPNQLCVRAGALGGMANAAVCLPARVAVITEGVKHKAGLDAITY